MSKTLSICNDPRPCFARGGMLSAKECTILVETYEPGKCPFCKKDRDVTNGRFYPFNKEYTNK